MSVVVANAASCAPPSRNVPTRSEHTMHGMEKLTGLGGRCTRAAQRGYSVCRVLIVDEVTNEAVRTPTSEPFSVSQLSVSYALSGGEHYYYNSCTKEEKSQKCNRFLLSGSIGASVGVGRFISYSIHGALSYEWTDCGGESSRSSLDISIEQCYFGQCWSIDAQSWKIF